ncbi:MAG: hypothetical protein RR601_06050 [Erysipelotrichales bacterium]
MTDTLNNFVKNLRTYKSIAVIGLSKNAGKTTTLNSVLELLSYEDVMLTSIGYDGEDTDLIFGTGKPTILVKEGMIIATAKKCVLTSDINFEILETTGYNTPLGEIVIVRCLSDGLVELAGPSYNKQLIGVINLLKGFNKNGLVIVDGALNRKTSSNPSVCDTTILCSGMTLSDDIKEVAKQTIFALNMLTLPKIDSNEIDFEKYEETVTLINKDGSTIPLNLPTTINSEKIIAKELSKETRYIVLKGPVTDKLAVALIKVRNLVDKVDIVVSNGTNVFIKNDTYDQLLKTKLSLKVAETIDVSAIAMNPNSLYRQFDPIPLVAEVKKNTDVFVYDFVGGE